MYYFGILAYNLPLLSPSFPLASGSQMAATTSVNAFTVDPSPVLITV